MAMEFVLPKLPFAKDALEPYISSETLEFHHGKHHKAYVTKLNELKKGTEFDDMSLSEIIMKSKGPVFNNSAQVWNHTFYWYCMGPDGSKEPKGQVKKAIEKKFGSFEEFKKQFTNTSVTTFGSGWGWLVKKSNGEIDLLSTSNADTAMKHDSIALLTCDVWEHAYYIDYRNERPKYLEKFWEIVNWDFVEENFARKENFKDPENDK